MRTQLSTVRGVPEFIQDAPPRRAQLPDDSQVLSLSRQIIVERH